MKLKEKLMLAYLNGQQEAQQQWARVNMKQVALAAILVFGAQAAMAAGGFDAPNKLAENIRDGIYAFVGIVCTAVLCWNGLQVLMKKKDWSDILGNCIAIVFIGGAIAFGAYLFAEGSKMKFG